jgi:Co/Zn/Cd efflux system component
MHPLSFGLSVLLAWWFFWKADKIRRDQKLRLPARLNWLDRKLGVWAGSVILSLAVLVLLTLYERLLDPESMTLVCLLGLVICGIEIFSSLWKELKP